MARSVSKGPFVDEHLRNKIDDLNKKNERQVVKTWSRRSTVTPDMPLKANVPAAFTVSSSLPEMPN